MKRRTTISPKTIATANTPRSLTERWVGNIMKRCSIIATTLLQNNRTRMLLYKNLQKELQILKRFCTCSGRFVPVFFKLGRLAGGRGGGGRYSFYICAAHRAGFLRRFGLKKGLPALPILLWNRIWFLRELRECMNVFIVSIPKWVRKKEKYTNSKWIWRIFLFALQISG